MHRHPATTRTHRGDPFGGHRRRGDSRQHRTTTDHRRVIRLGPQTGQAPQTASTSETTAGTQTTAATSSETTAGTQTTTSTEAGTTQREPTGSPRQHGGERVTGGSAAEHAPHPTGLTEHLHRGAEQLLHRLQRTSQTATHALQHLHRRLKHLSHLAHRVGRGAASLTHLRSGLRGGLTEALTSRLAGQLTGLRHRAAGISGSLRCVTERRRGRDRNRDRRRGDHLPIGGADRGVHHRVGGVLGVQSGDQRGVLPEEVRRLRGGLTHPIVDRLDRRDHRGPRHPIGLGDCCRHRGLLERNTSHGAQPGEERWGRSLRRGAPHPRDRGDRGGHLTAGDPHRGQRGFRQAQPRHRGGQPGRPGGAGLDDRSVQLRW